MMARERNEPRQLDRQVPRLRPLHDPVRVTRAALTLGRPARPAVGQAIAGDTAGSRMRLPLVP
jgi:hypothetical protein